MDQILKIKDIEEPAELPSMQVETSDKQIVEIEEPIVRMSAYLVANLDDVPAEPIPLKEVSSRTLNHVLKWCRKHVKDPVDIYECEEESNGYGFQPVGERYRWRRRFVVIPKWDNEFFGALDNGTLFSLVNAAHLLQVKKLLDMSCQVVANLLRNKSAEQIRKDFHVKGDGLDDVDDDDIHLESIDTSRSGRCFPNFYRRQLHFAAMTVQTDSELANFQQAKSLLFKWNLQFDRAEKYLRQFALVDFTDLKMIYSVQAPIASVIPVWFIALACCHYFWAGSTALSYALLSLYANICILFIAFLFTVVQLHEAHMSGLVLFAIQYITIIELYGFVWLGNIMTEMILSGEIPL
ncbi:suppressor of kinetochore protein mutant [Tyrophagus putrescentiae]|nr:suppressor of kinetochore protein mutant [Tyrophagus putrescentiae]